MGARKTEHSKIIDNLIVETITYRLSEVQALEYIKLQSGITISRGTYYERKKNLENDEHAREFIHYQTRLGFVLAHEKHIRSINKIMDDSIKRCDIEMNKEVDKRDEPLLIKLKDNLTRIVHLSAELNVGNPIIATMKADIDNADSKYNILLKKFRKMNPDIAIN